MALAILSVRFYLQASTPIFLPNYSGSTYRGGFGNAFKRSVCVFSGGDCPSCAFREKCAYLYVFETPVERLKELNLHNGFAPHPFVLEPKLNYANPIPPGDVFEVSLNLIGKGIEYLPFFVFTIERLGKIGIGRGRGKYSVLRVECIETPSVIIYEGKEGLLRKNYVPLQWQGPSRLPSGPRNWGSLVIRFLTPTRIKYQGSYLRHIDFDLLITNLLRRIRMLDILHGDGKMNYDHRKWIELARKVQYREGQIRWYDWNRYSHRQRSRIPMGGFVGWARFEGPVEPFREILEIGSKIHVGKGTAFGLGKFVVEDGETTKN